MDKQDIEVFRIVNMNADICELSRNLNAISASRKEKQAEPQCTALDIVAGICLALTAILAIVIQVWI